MRCSMAFTHVHSDLDYPGSTGLTFWLVMPLLTALAVVHHICLRSVLAAFSILCFGEVRSPLLTILVLKPV